MPFAEDVVLVSPIDPDHPLVGKRAATDFLRTKVFPKIPVRKAEIERHVVDGDCVGTLWKATFAPAGGSGNRDADFRLLSDRQGGDQGIAPAFRSRSSEGSCFSLAAHVN